jgi:hypothetical protein
MIRNFTKLLFITTLTLVFGVANAQTDSVKVRGMGKNLIKVNLTAIPLNNYSFIYERAIGKKISIGLGFRYMPEDNLPFLDQIGSAIDDEDTFNKIKDFKTGNMAITPEIKFYCGKGVFRGFYVAPFARYAEYKGNVPFEFEYDGDENSATPNESATIKLNGKITSITGGLLLGAQWKLSKLIYLNWEILGPSYGSSKGNITGLLAGPLATDEAREGLRAELKDLEESDIPLIKIKTSVNDDTNEAKADFTGPWAGVRASIGLGFRF